MGSFASSKSSYFRPEIKSPCWAERRPRRPPPDAGRHPRLAFWQAPVKPAATRRPPSIGADPISGPSLTSKEIIILKNQTVSRPSYVCDGNPITGKMVQLYWISLRDFGSNKPKIKIISVNCDLLNSLLVKSKPYCYTTFNLLYYHMQKELYTFGISCKRRWQCYHGIWEDKKKIYIYILEWILIQ